MVRPAQSDARPVVASLHRYPVKSMTGEGLLDCSVDARGVVADGQWSVRTAQGLIGSGKRTRRFAALPRLQLARAEQVEGAVVVTLPDGTAYDVDAPVLAEHLSALVGEPVSLARETGVSHFDDGAVSVVARASVDAVAEDCGTDVDVVRFRPNVVVDGVPAFCEAAWVGRLLRLGSAVLQVEMESPRGVMVDQETDDLPAQPGTLRAVGRLNDASLGVIASVVQPGVVRVGDRLTLV